MRRFIGSIAIRAAVLGLTTSVLGCAVGPEFRRPPAPTDLSYGKAGGEEKAPSSPESKDDSQRLLASMDIPAEWWTLFQSPHLDRLVKQAMTANPDVRAAQAALRQARELYAAQRASFLPTVQGGVSATRSRNAIGTVANPTVLPQASPYYNLYTAQVSVSYLPDVFGVTRRSVETAKAQAEASHFQLEATYLTLSSNVVVTAIQEASLRGQIAATTRLMDLQRQLTVTLHRQEELGTASHLDVLAQESADAQIATTLPPLQKQLGQTRDALTALLGRLPSQEPDEIFLLQEMKLPEELPISLPSKLVEQRPDIRAAEENLHVASAQAGVAVGDLLPQLSITADTGTSALRIGELFATGNGFWDVGASLTQTLFDAGARLHRHRAADAALDEAGAQYRAVVILGCQNVADTLRALQADADAVKATYEATRATKAVFDLATQQRKLGAISVVSVLNAEQSYQQSELALVQAQANRFTDTAGLFQALGGGWWNRDGRSMQ